MNIKEIGRQMKREFIDDFVDAFKSIDSRPEHITSFPAHLAGCSRTQPLKVSIEFIPLPSLYSANFRTELRSITCPECKGTQIFEKG